MMIGKLEFSGSFFLIWAWLNYMDRQGIVPLAMVACIIHELGHYLAVKWLGGEVRYIRLTGIGAEMALAHPMSYWREGVSALSGPGVNLLLAAFCCQMGWGIEFSGINLVLGCFNLLPAGRLDGGRALYCTLALLLNPDCAERVLVVMSALVTTIILMAGLLIFGFGGNLTLLIVALWMVAVFFSGKKKGIRACHMRRKRVK